jgi:hypothetical protein
MKFLAIIGALAVAVSGLSLRDEHEESPYENHDLLFCCKRKGGEKCGLVWKSCCQPGKCAQNAGVWYCPDQFQLKC